MRADHNTRCQPGLRSDPGIGMNQYRVRQAGTLQCSFDLAAHMGDAVNSLRIVLAADESVRTGKTVELGQA